MSRRDEYAAMTKAAIIDAAIDEFVAFGYTAVTVDEIARRIRVSKGAVYHHFPDKATVFQEGLIVVVTGVVSAAGDASWDQWCRRLADAWQGDERARRLAKIAQAAPGHHARLAEALTPAVGERLGTDADPIEVRMAAALIATALVAGGPAMELVCQMGGGLAEIRFADGAVTPAL